MIYRQNRPETLLQPHSQKTEQSFLIKLL